MKSAPRLKEDSRTSSQSADVSQREGTRPRTGKKTDWSCLEQGVVSTEVRLPGHRRQRGLCMRSLPSPVQTHPTRRLVALCAEDPAAQMRQASCHPRDTEDGEIGADDTIQQPLVEVPKQQE